MLTTPTGPVGVQTRRMNSPAVIRLSPDAEMVHVLVAELRGGILSAPLVSRLGLGAGFGRRAGDGGPGANPNVIDLREPGMNVRVRFSWRGT
jgi:hypothetical protein